MFFFYPKEQKALGMRCEIPIIEHKVFKYWFRTSFTLRKSFEEPLCVVETQSSDFRCFTEILIQVRILFPVLRLFWLLVWTFLQIDPSLRKGQYTKFFCCFPTFPFGNVNKEQVSRDVFMQPCILIILFVNNISLMHTNISSLSIPVSRYKKKRFFMQHMYNKWNITATHINN